MFTNHKILGMKTNIAYGVCFIVPILSLVVLLTDKALTRENKQFMCEAVMGMITAIVLGLLSFFMHYALAYVVWAIMIFFGVLNLTGRITHLPFLSALAEKIVK